MGKQVLEVVPLLEGEDHVRPHDQGQPCTRIPLLKLQDRVVGVTLPVSLELQGRHFHAIEIAEGHFAEFQTLLRRRAPLFHFLVRRFMIGHDQKQIRVQRIQRGDHRLAVPEMRRVEASAVDGNVHARPVFRVVGHSGFLR